VRVVNSPARGNCGGGGGGGKHLLLLDRLQNRFTAIIRAGISRLYLRATAPQQVGALPGD
jgi:hypothetical protein